MKQVLKNLLPHILVLFAFFLLAIVYFKPYVFDNKVLAQHDLIQASGMKGEIVQYQKHNGTTPLWTNGMFSGMPSYQIQYYSNSPLKYLFTGFLLGHAMSPPWPPIFLLMAGMYLLLLLFKLDWRIAALGGITFGLATNHIILVEAGHMTKLVASAYMAPIFGGVILVLRRKYIYGGTIIALFVAMQLIANHVQMTYYWVILLALYGIIALIYAIKGNSIKEFAIAASVILVAGILGISANTGKLWTTYEYSQESIRGKSDLSGSGETSGSSSTSQEGGLSYDYAFNWSYGIMETFNFLIPAYRGGSSFKSFYSDRSSNFSKVIRSSQDFRRLDSQSQNLIVSRVGTHYWGEQPFTSGPVYMGSLLILLFFIGLFMVEDRLRWWAIITVVLSVMLAWGKNFSGFNFWIFDNIPLSNKFRATTMILGITNLIVAIVAFVGLQAWVKKSTSNQTKLKALKIGGGITLVLLVLAAISALSETFLSTQNEAMLSQIKQSVGANLTNKLSAALIEDRSSLLWTDWFRSLGIVTLSLGLLWAYIKSNINSNLVIGFLLLISVVDLWTVDNRFLDFDRFENKRKVIQDMSPKPADEQILNDKEPSFRVLDLRGQDPFQNATTTLFHKSIGGYHAAKLSRYQEMIERYLGSGISQKNAHLFNMFNTKYVISPNGQVQINKEAYGNAWFVKEFEILNTPLEVIESLGKLNPIDKALFSIPYADGVKDFRINYDSTAHIRMVSYHPDQMEYVYSAKDDQLVLFSEVYYPEEKGWHLYVDGKRHKGLYKANYALRSAILPAGNHELSMKFEPNSYRIGETISLVNGMIILLMLAYCLWLWYKDNFN